MSDNHAVLNAALEFHANGVVVVPVLNNGEKRPIGGWKQYRDNPPSVDDLRDWFASGHPGIGVLCGSPSNSLEMIEMEGRAVAEGVHTEFAQNLRDHGMGDLWNKILNGYAEVSPSGGFHFFYHVLGASAGNTKLAQRPPTEEEAQDRPAQKRYPLIETRGDGGFTVVAPSHGPVHASGKPWKLMRGGPSSIPTITESERDALYAIARLSDRIPQLEIHKPPRDVQDLMNRGELEPGSDFNLRGDWHEILTDHDWVPAFTTREGVTNWIRPDKEDPGTSATTGYGDRGDFMYVFSNSSDLPSEVGMSKFAVYAHLNHGGDFSAAARDLRFKGYGAPKEGATALAAQPQTPEQIKKTVSSFSDRLTEGASFVLDAPAYPPPLWGGDAEVLWSEGEPCILTGPTGVGKTTLGGQVIAGRLGVMKNVLGKPVKEGNRVLYLAMDRPSQIRRALRRLFGNTDRDLLARKLVVWEGPPPADLAKNSRLLLDLALAADADTVVIDSLKDAAGNLSAEETGQGLNSAFQHCVSNGVEVLAYHHQVKRGFMGAPAGSIEDVYGSGWITAGAGSVILLLGAPGDLVVEMRHLKQPAEVVGPYKLLHDHTAGTTSVFEAAGELELIDDRPKTAFEVASRLMGESPSDNDKARTERRLNSLVNRGLARVVPTPRGRAYIATGAISELSGLVQEEQ